MSKTAQQTHDQIAATGARIFKMALVPSNSPRAEEGFWVHPDKTTAQWREDLRNFLKGATAADPAGVDEDGDAEGGYADSVLFSSLTTYLHNLGYHELDDVVSDVFEGRVTTEVARIVDCPSHSDIQADGFGHYGWESKPTAMKNGDDPGNANTFTVKANYAGVMEPD